MIQKVMSKIGLRDKKNDFAYWQSRSYQERLEALEQIRREYHLWRYGVEPGFQRVYKVVKR
jgi:hypothetical protein